MPIAESPLPVSGEGREPFVARETFEGSAMSAASSQPATMESRNKAASSSETLDEWLLTPTPRSDRRTSASLLDMLDSRASSYTRHRRGRSCMIGCSLTVRASGTSFCESESCRLPFGVMGLELLATSPFEPLGVGGAAHNPLVVDRRLLRSIRILSL